MSDFCKAAWSGFGNIGNKQETFGKQDSHLTLCGITLARLNQMTSCKDRSVGPEACQPILVTHGWLAGCWLKGRHGKLVCLSVKASSATHTHRTSPTLCGITLARLNQMTSCKDRSVDPEAHQPILVTPGWLTGYGLCDRLGKTVCWCVYQCFFPYKHTTAHMTQTRHRVTPTTPTWLVVVYTGLRDGVPAQDLAHTSKPEL